MSLLAETSAEENETIMATKIFKNCIIVAQKTQMNIVSQQSDSIVVFLHTSSSKFSDNVSSYNIYVVKQYIECWQILHNWNIVHVDYFELTGTASIHFFMIGLKILYISSYSR